MAQFGVYQVNEATRLLHANHDTGVLSGRVVPTDAETAAALAHHADCTPDLVQEIEAPDPVDEEPSAPAPAPLASLRSLPEPPSSPPTPTAPAASPTPDPEEH